MLMLTEVLGPSFIAIFYQAVGRRSRLGAKDNQTEKIMLKARERENKE